MADAVTFLIRCNVAKCSSFNDNDKSALREIVGDNADNGGKKLYVSFRMKMQGLLVMYYSDFLY